MTRSFISAQQVAELAGVSRSQVSRTFTPGASVSAETRERVLAAAETLGYHVNHLARGLTGEASGIVCLIVAAVDTPFQSRLVKVMTSRLQHAGKVTLVINSSGDAADVAAALRQTLNYRADATVVLSGTPDASLVRTCLDHGQQVILINRGREFDAAHTIVVANDAAARQAATAFRRAGCQNFACVTSDAGTPSLMERERAFVEAAFGAGVVPQVWRGGRTSYASGVAAARHLLTGEVRPDAVFCVNDLMACGFMDAARHQFGLAVPQDLCVIGFDDIDEADWSSYDLTTFQQPVGAIADHVAELIDADGPGGRGTRRSFEAPLIWRNSVRGAPAASPAAPKRA